jgi:hypothetical protein
MVEMNLLEKGYNKIKASIIELTDRRSGLKEQIKRFHIHI